MLMCMWRRFADDVSGRSTLNTRMEVVIVLLWIAVKCCQFTGAGDGKSSTLCLSVLNVLSNHISTNTNIDSVGNTAMEKFL
jgi:hypothetical protein